MMRVTIDSRIRLALTDLCDDDDQVAELKATFTYKNPQHAKLVAMGRRWNSEPEEYETFRVDGEELSLPRGGLQKLRDLCDDWDLDYELVDNRSMGAPHITGSWIDPWQLGADLFPKYKRIPWDHQAEFVEVAKRRQQLLARAPTGAGKTDAVLMLIAELQVPALVIMWDTGLLKQWQERIEEVFGIAVPDQGLIQGKHFRLKPITLAMQQTLNRWTEEKWERLQYEGHSIFGGVYCDECFEGETPVLMEDGTHKCIADVQVGDEVAVGGKVLDTMQQEYVGPMYRLAGWLATAGHAIATGDGWVPLSKVRSDDITWRDSEYLTRLVQATTLQDRLGSSACESSDRVGRLQSQHAGNAGGVRSQDILPRIEEVVGIEIPGACRLQESRPAVQASRWRASTVYNIETERNVYVAGGTLVHNCQRYAASTFTGIVDRFDCHYRIGVSADERRKDKKTFLIYDQFGPVEHEVKKADLIAKRIIHEVECYVVPTDFTAPWYVEKVEDKQYDLEDFNRLLDEMQADADRNALALHLITEAVQAGLPTLSFTHRVDHARAIDTALTQAGIQSGLALGGKDWSDIFDDTIAGLRDGSLMVGCGTFGKLGVGHDIPTVAAGVAVTPVHNNKPFQGQVKGRICRTSQGKQNARIIMLWDRQVFGDAPLYNLKKWNEVCKVWNEWDNCWQEVGAYIKEQKHGNRTGDTTEATEAQGIFVSANRGQRRSRTR